MMVPKCSISSSKEVQLFQSLNGISRLAETRPFKAWFLDQFGVLHDGKQPYPGAILTLENLAKNGAKMVIISNSSRRASTTIEKLKSLGFDPSLFLGAITSGELTHQYLQRRDDTWFAALGRSCIHMTWSDRGAISLEGLGLHVVDNAEDAEFILAHGTEALGLSSGAANPMKLEDLEKILVRCAAKKLPMVVANPDYVTVEARALRVMPGTLADKYEKLGGEVKWMGKPDQIIYQSAMVMAGVDASECIAVGDSLHHDIKGANKAGIQSAFITCGIHANELGLGSFGEVADLSSVEALASKYEAYPSYVLPSFTWARELAKVCCCEVGLIAFSPDGRPYLFAAAPGPSGNPSSSFSSIVRRYRNHPITTSALRVPTAETDINSYLDELAATQERLLLLDFDDDTDIQDAVF